MKNNQLKRSRIAPALAFLFLASAAALCISNQTIPGNIAAIPGTFPEVETPMTLPEIQRSAPPVVDYTRFGSDYTGMVTKLTQLATTFPNYAELIDINTLYGVPLIPRTGGGTYTMYALRITNESLGFHKPEVLLQGGIHGDEYTSPSVLIWFADWFLRYSVGYTGGGDTNYIGFEKEELQWLINNREIYVLPAFNPDGIVRNTRNDQTGLDMNRDFDWHDTSGSTMTTRNSQCLREFINHHQFRIGYGGHDGAHFVCYPMDSVRGAVSGLTIAGTNWYTGGAKARIGRTATWCPPDFYFYDSVLATMINYTGNTPDGYFNSGTTSYLGNFCPGGQWYEADGCQDTFMYSANEPDSAAQVTYDGSYPGSGIFWFTIEYSGTKNTPTGEFGTDSSTPASCWVAGGKRHLLFLIDMAQPYVRYDKVVTPANHTSVQPGSQVTIKYQVNGSMVCDETRIQWGTNPNPKASFTYTTANDQTFRGRWTGGTGWNLALDGSTSTGHWFQQTITMPTTPGDYYFTARAKVDQRYGTAMGNLTNEPYTQNTYMRMMSERAEPSWSETITGTDGSETMSYKEFWYSDVLHVKVVADPVINITTPIQNGEVYGNSFGVFVNATDPDSTITSVQVQVNGGSWTSATFQSGTTWRANINFNGYTEGSTVNITARCTNNDVPTVTKYTSRFALVNNYLAPLVAITSITNGSTMTAGSSLPVTWTANGARVFTIDKTQLYWTNGTRMVWPQHPLDLYGGPSPITFDTSGTQGYFYSTGNTWGASGADDGWDWARNLGYVATSTSAMTTFRDPDAQSGPVPHSQHPGSIEVEIGGRTDNTIDSGAFGIKFYVDTGLGLKSVIVSFNWWAHDRVGILGAADETEKPMYLKARFGSETGGMTYIQGTGAQGGDAAADIIYFTSPNGGGPRSYSGTENINVTTLVTGTGWYYLDLGAVFDARGTGQTVDEGVCAFYDNIDVTVSRYKIVTDPFVSGHLNRWSSVAKSGSPGSFSDTITLPNMPGQKVYIAANASSDGQPEQGRSLIWEINLIASGVSITNMHANPTSGYVGTIFTIRGNVASAHPISAVRAYIEAPDEMPVATILLTNLGNGTYQGTWNSAGQLRRSYFVDFWANNTIGETQSVNNGATFQIINTPPVASSLTLTPASPVTTDDLVAGWSYSDANGDPQGAARIRWYRGGVLQAAYNDLSTLPASATAKGQQWYFTVEPYDGSDYGSLQPSPTRTIGNTAPAASALTLTPASPITADDLVAGWTYSDADSDPQGAAYIRWYLGGILQAAYNDLSTLPAIATSKDQQWYFTVEPFDGFNYGTLQTSPNKTIGNTAPVTSALTLMPASPVTADDLLAGWTYSDADSDPQGAARIRWYLGGILQATYNDLSTLPAIATAKGQQWYFTVEPFDGTIYGSLQPSAPVTIQNAAPIASTLTLSPVSPVTADDLVAGWTYSDADSDPQGAARIRWYLGGILQAAYNDLSTLPASATAKGQQWHFTVEPFDGTSYGSLQTSPTVTIQNTGPTAPSSMSPTQTTDITPLIAWTGHSDVDGDPLDFYIRIVNGSNPTQIIIDWQFTAVPSYQVLISLELYQTYNVLMISSDGALNSTPFQASLNTTNAAPEWTSGDHISPDQDSNPLLSISWDAATDPDGQIPEYYFKIVSNLTGLDLFNWQFTGTTCSFTVNSSHELNPGEYRIQIMAFDGINYSAILEEILVILNSPPIFTSVVLNATSARELDIIMAIPGGFDDINSLDEENWYYEWLVNGSIVLTGFSTLGMPILLNGTHFNKHDMVSCRVFAMDSHNAFSAANTTAAIPILNSAPIVVEVLVEKAGTKFLQNETFYAQIIIYDADADPTQNITDWYVAAMGFNYTWVYTGSTIYDPNRLYYHVGDAVIVSAVVSDGEDSSMPVNSTMIQIENSKPGICTNPWLDTTVGEFSIPIVRWSSAFDWDGGFQTYEVMIGTKPLTNNLLGVSRVSEPYAALCYRYLNNGSIYRGKIYVHIRAMDDQGALSDQLLIFEVNWSPPSEERPAYLLGLSLLFIIGGIALAFMITSRGERAMDASTVMIAKKKTPGKKKVASKPAPSYQEIPMTPTVATTAPTSIPIKHVATVAPSATAPMKPVKPVKAVKPTSQPAKNSSSPLTGTPAAMPVSDYKQVLKDRMGQVKNAIASKDYNNALAWLQEMIVIAEKNGELELAGNYKKKFEEVLGLSVD